MMQYLVGGVILYVASVYVRALTKVRAKRQMAGQVNGRPVPDEHSPLIVVRED